MGNVISASLSSLFTNIFIIDITRNWQKRSISGSTRAYMENGSLTSVLQWLTICQNRHFLFVAKGAELRNLKK